MFQMMAYRSVFAVSIGHPHLPPDNILRYCDIEFCDIWSVSWWMNLELLLLPEAAGTSGTSWN